MILSTATAATDSINDQQPAEKPHQGPSGGVTGRYTDDRHHATLVANASKCRAVMRCFGLTPTAVARATGVSRCYVSRIVSEADEFVGGDVFYRRLEQALGSLVQNRSRQVFAVEPVSLGDSDGILG